MPAPLDGSFTFEIYSDIAGGTGRFEGATGTTVATGSGRQVVVGVADNNGFEFEIKGTIE